ncbi:uncharacterized protein STAUR_8309 [Stigmatella aurantiaca DW4/3-1]|uniref:Uncharacterized protein n=1 Tax=Stigmatella aurantiaca (strain DW4/3-1) TaxID=378806 RepID=E3FXT4_STIAD|nr:uncharacterized protein STAUR_8309 [Stigmatella aurantiaca DW4/3-1]
MGVLLPLPIVLLAWELLRQEVPVGTPPVERISPMLDTEQRMRLMTYGRRCGPGAECEPPLGCLFDVRSVRSYCTDSQCTADAQCPEDQLCQSLATWGGGPQVRVCVPMGIRKEGEGCIKLSPDKEHACEAGLLCGGQEGWCARPCQPGDMKGCPEGFFCADTIPQSVCLPTCETQGCPQGQQCIHFKEGSSQCAQVYGPDCLQTPCPEGRKCDVQYEPPYPGKAWMACVARCGEGYPPCEAGSVCDGWECVQPCEPQGPEVCGEGYFCHRLTEQMPSSCLPDFWRSLAH